MALSGRSMAIRRCRCCGTSATCCSSPVLGTSELQQVAEVPQQRHLRIAIERPLNAIDLALDHGLTSLEIREPSGCLAFPVSAWAEGGQFNGPPSSAIAPIGTEPHCALLLNTFPNIASALSASCVPTLALSTAMKSFICASVSPVFIAAPRWNWSWPAVPVMLAGAAMVTSSLLWSSRWSRTKMSANRGSFRNVYTTRVNSLYPLG